MNVLLRPMSEPRALRMLHALSPAAVVVAYFVASLQRVFASKRSIPEQEKVTRERSLPVASMVITALVMVTYVAESILLACVLPSHAATSADHNLVFTLFSGLVWLILLLRLIDTPSSDIRRTFSAAWAFALVFDIAILVLGLHVPKLSGFARVSRLSWQSLRVTLLLILVGIGLGIRLARQTEKVGDEEIAPLLAQIERHLSSSGGHHVNGSAYGTAAASDPKKNNAKDSDHQKADNENEDSDDEDQDNAATGKLKKDWWVYTKAFAIFLPHLWPKKSLKLRLHFPALGLCLLSSRALNVLMPLQLGVIINSLQASGGKVPWLAIGLFVLLRFLESSAGVSLVQSWLWMPINRYTTEELSSAAYNKVMSLSCDFHDSKKSGRTWRIVARGESLADLVHVVGFEMIPMAADLAIAVTVFWWLFDAYMAFIVALSSVLFLWTTAKTVPPKIKRQRAYINAWEDEYSQMTESSLNWTTVSYFNQIKYEQKRFKEAVSKTQGKLISYRALSFIISGLRAVILQSGLLAAASLAAYQISMGNRSVGDFVVLVSYWAQLTVPLTFFASGFSRIAKSLVDAEKLLELLQTEPTVQNHQDAAEFVLKQGQVDFDRVCFSYDGKRQVADDLSFRAEPGQTVAFVGETGGGKSTILKLLFRFYDTTGGTVMIDGQDVRHVTMESLRANVGCVPQDPILFNKTIMENLLYANLDATEDEVHAACKAVALHDKILSYTKGYSEKVGERGVKLSGGELQRIAIARAILRNPKILLLDEATSSVDSETEALIQNSLKKLCAGRTTFVIAHRLSTIIHANLIMVIKNGRIIERGSHDKLMESQGHYSKLWSRQLRLQRGESRSRSRSCSPEKTTVLVDDPIENNNEDGKGLLEKMDSHGSRCSENGSGRAGEEGDRMKSMRAMMDTNVRGRSPREKDLSMRRKILRSKSPYRKDVDGSRERGKSHSATCNGLKPDAPEFVPRNLPIDVPHLRHPASNLRGIGDHCQEGPHISHSCTAAGAYGSFGTDSQKENFFSSSEPSKISSSSTVPAPVDGKITRFGFYIPDGMRRKKISGTNTSVMGLHMDAGTSEGGSEQSLIESCTRTNPKRHAKKSKYGKQMFNSRRNLSRSEPQVRAPKHETLEQEPDVETGLYSDPNPVERGGRFATRRSSAPNEASLNGSNMGPE